jgi:hypothetical protein
LRRNNNHPKIEKGGVMAIKKRVERLEKKSGGRDNFSKVPEKERVVVVSGYTQSERDEKFAEKIKILHEKYGDFNNRCLLRISIRKFCKPQA